MGNYNFRAESQPQKGEVVMIKQDQFSKDYDMPDNILGTGSKAKVLHGGQLHQSRPNSRKIDYTTVMLPNGRKEMYLTVNLRRKG